MNNKNYTLGGGGTSHNKVSLIRTVALSIAVVAIVCCNLLLGYTLLKTDAVDASTAVAMIEFDGETYYYDTIDAACYMVHTVYGPGNNFKSTADNPAKITLLQDVKITSSLDIGISGHGGYVIFDLHGYKLLSELGGAIIDASNGVVLEIIDSVGGGEIVCSGYGVYVESNSKLIMNGGKIDAKTVGVFSFVSTATLIINGGEITSSGNYGINFTGGSITMTGGSVSGTTNAMSVGNASVEYGEDIITVGNKVFAHATHDYQVEITKQPTCTEAGEETYTCTICGHTYTEEIPATGHDYHAVVTKAPTCTEAGEMSYVCETCGDVERTAEIDALGHDWGEWEVVTEPTTESEGEERRYCLHDESHYQTRPIPQLAPEPEPEPEANGLPWWVWVAVSGGVVGLAGVTTAVVLVCKRRKK